MSAAGTRRSSRLTRIAALLALALLVSPLALVGCGDGNTPRQAFEKARSAWLSGDMDALRNAFSAQSKERAGAAAKAGLEAYMDDRLPPIEKLRPLVSAIVPDVIKAIEADMPEYENRLEAAKAEKEAAESSGDGNRKEMARRRLQNTERAYEDSRAVLDKLKAGEFFYELDAAMAHVRKNNIRDGLGALKLDLARALAIPDDKIGKWMDNVQQGAQGYQIVITFPDGGKTSLSATQEKGSSEWKLDFPVR